MCWILAGLSTLLVLVFWYLGLIVHVFDEDEACLLVGSKVIDVDIYLTVFVYYVHYVLSFLTLPNAPIRRVYHGPLWCLGGTTLSTTSFWS